MTFHLWFALSAAVFVGGCVIAGAKHRLVALLEQRVAAAGGEGILALTRMDRLASSFRGNAGLTPLRIFTLAHAAALYVLLLPITHALIGSWAQSVLANVYHLLQVFVGNGDLAGTYLAYRVDGGFWPVTESFYVTVMFVIAPLTAAGLVLSFFQSVTAYARLWFHRRRDVAVFSELNERSLSLAASIRQTGTTARKRPVIVFCTVARDAEGTIPELLGRARQIGAICLGNEITTIPLHLHRDRAHIELFLIKDDQAANGAQAEQLQTHGGYLLGRDNTDLYVFASGSLARDISRSVAVRAGQPSQASQGMRIRLINPVRTQIYDWLWRSTADEPGTRPVVGTPGASPSAGVDLFSRAAEVAPGDWVVGAAIVGLGNHGTELARALTWFLQMDGPGRRFRPVIDIFDADPVAVQRFHTRFPELSGARSAADSVSAPRQDAGYEFRFHSGIDVLGSELLSTIAAIEPLSAVFLCVGDDALADATAVELRRTLSRMNPPRAGIDIFIVSSSWRTQPAGALSSGLRVLGRIPELYRYHTVIHSELDAHLRAGFGNNGTRASTEPPGNDEFPWNDDHRYREAASAAIHQRARVTMGADALTEDASARLEHARWTAFMRSEGFVAGDATELVIAKTHRRLVGFDQLPAS